MKKILGLFALAEMLSPKNTSDERTSFPEFVTLPKAYFYVMFLALFAAGCQNESELSSESPIVGVWKMSEYAFADGDTSFSYVPQPNLMICTEKYYSVETVNGTKPRPLIPDGKTRRTISDEERIAILVPYTSFSGTYEIEGDSVVST
ncbi:MAG TPA: hypothetical protein VFE57_08300, partial [Cyclobacteriaceae bacterium]|nr:hypothetical protein [Cyclobacteriaceae bacterium]